MSAVVSPSYIVSTLNAIQKYFKSTVMTTENIPYNATHILDPTSTIIRLALLGFFDQGTKISIQNNSIVYFSPGMLQGTFRWSTGSTRTELHLLCKPITRFLNKYRNSEQMKVLIQLAARGIHNLMATYHFDSGMTHYSLKFYNMLFNGYVNDKDAMKTSQILCESTKQDFEHHKRTLCENKDFDTFANIWSSNEIQIITLILTELETVVKQKKKDMLFKSYVSCIQSILQAKDNTVKTIIQLSAQRI